MDSFGLNMEQTEAVEGRNVDEASGGMPVASRGGFSRRDLRAALLARPIPRSADRPRTTALEKWLTPERQLLCSFLLFAVMIGIFIWVFPIGSTNMSPAFLRRNALRGYRNLNPSSSLGSSRTGHGVGQFEDISAGPLRVLVFDSSLEAATSWLETARSSVAFLDGIDGERKETASANSMPLLLS